MNSKAVKFRIGQGSDVHAFEEGRKLILGGIEIPHAKGLKGHSDADVVLHALTDAILGALAWDDIGAWFPDTDEQFKNIDSSILLAKVWEKARAEGWSVMNLDITVLLESPKLRPHILSMRQRISDILGVSLGQVSVKATTTERLGFVGREEGIFSSASVLLEQTS